MCAPRLYPATPGWGVQCGCVCLGSGLSCALPLLGWGVWVCVCLCACSACTPPLLAGVCAGGVCACARVSGAPCHSWLSWCGVCVFVCVLRTYPATPGWGVRCGCLCLGSGYGCAPPLLALCLCARSACTPPLLAGVCDVSVNAWAWVTAAPRHSWPGCWGVCVFVCALCLYPTTPLLGVRCGCVCLSSVSGCAPPLLARVLGCVCVCVRAPRVPRHSWLGCVVLVYVLGVGFWLPPATPGWSVGVCVCL